MSRPFKEVILFHNGDHTTDKILVSDITQYSLNLDRVNILWRGSFSQFKRDFEIPDDAPLSTKQTELTNGNKAEFVKKWNWTTMNFKFNYQIWYKDANGSYYVNGSNNTIDLTIPNVLSFDGNKTNDNAIKYYNSGSEPERFYNPNLFLLPVGINTFITSNKVNDFTSGAPTGSNRDVYLMFRYGVGDDDIQICLLTRSNNIMNYNSKPLVMPYASLTFTGFNKIKRLAGARDNI